MHEFKYVFQDDLLDLSLNMLIESNFYKAQIYSPRIFMQESLSLISSYIKDNIIIISEFKHNSSYYIQFKYRLKMFIYVLLVLR